ncbi:MAG: hypothetical protein M0001_03640 [Treponema sp.]|nr:hypothetical protein [Treponema sp.]
MKYNRALAEALARGEVAIDSKWKGLFDSAKAIETKYRARIAEGYLPAKVRSTAMNDLAALSATIATQRQKEAAILRQRAVARREAVASERRNHPEAAMLALREAELAIGILSNGERASAALGFAEGKVGLSREMALVLGSSLPEGSAREALAGKIRRDNLLDPTGGDSEARALDSLAEAIESAPGQIEATRTSSRGGEPESMRVDLAALIDLESEVA